MTAWCMTGLSTRRLCRLREMKERTITLGGFSKSHAMTGWRVGWAAAPSDLFGGMLKIHQYAMMSAPTVAQHRSAGGGSRGRGVRDLDARGVRPAASADVARVQSVGADLRRASRCVLRVSVGVLGRATTTRRLPSSCCCRSRSRWCQARRLAPRGLVMCGPATRPATRRLRKRWNGLAGSCSRRRWRSSAIDEGASLRA